MKKLAHRENARPQSGPDQDLYRVLAIAQLPNLTTLYTAADVCRHSWDPQTDVERYKKEKALLYGWAKANYILETTENLDSNGRPKRPAKWRGSSWQEQVSDFLWNEAVDIVNLAYALREEDESRGVFNASYWYSSDQGVFRTFNYKKNEAGSAIDAPEKGGRAKIDRPPLEEAESSDLPQRFSLRKLGLPTFTLKSTSGYKVLLPIGALLLITLLPKILATEAEAIRLDFKGRVRDIQPLKDGYSGILSTWEGQGERYTRNDFLVTWDSKGRMKTKESVGEPAIREGRDFIHGAALCRSGVVLDGVPVLSMYNPISRDTWVEVGDLVIENDPGFTNFTVQEDKVLTNNCYALGRYINQGNFTDPKQRPPDFDPRCDFAEALTIPSATVYCFPDRPVLYADNGDNVDIEISFEREDIDGPDKTKFERLITMDRIGGLFREGDLNLIVWRHQGQWKKGEINFNTGQVRRVKELNLTGHLRFHHTGLELVGYDASMGVVHRFNRTLWDRRRLAPSRWY